MHQQRCEITGVDFEVSEAEAQQLQRMGDLDGLLSESLPLPRVHPFEGVRQLFSYGHLLYLHRGQSAYSGKPQLTRYNPALPYRICTLDEFNSGAVDNCEFGQPYDFSRPFFQQFDQLMHRVLHPPLSSTNTEDSDYVNGAMNVSRCYLSFNIVESQDCLYCVSTYFGNDNLYCVQATRCQYCYRCLDIDSCYECQHCDYCVGCSGCFGCYDCVGCHDCFGCVGLRNAKHCFLNEQLTATEYQRRFAELNVERFSERERALAVCQQFISQSAPRRVFLINTEQCSGNYLRNCRNLVCCYHGRNGEDCGYLLPFTDAKDCWRGWSMGSELTYLAGSMKSRAVAYSYAVLNSENIIYSFHCYDRSAFNFGCVGLRGKSYCLLNKQYSPAEFRELIPRVIKQMQQTGEWGSFLPPRFSPHPYHESTAAEFVESLPNHELLRRGYRVELPTPAVAEIRDDRMVIDAGALPDSLIDEELEPLLRKAVRCPETGVLFNFQASELAFYQRHRIPPPRRHWRTTLSAMLHSRELIPAI